MAVKLADAVKLIRLGKTSYGLSDSQMIAIAATISGYISTSAMGADSFDKAPAFYPGSRVYNEMVARYIQTKTANDLNKQQGSKGSFAVWNDDSVLTKLSFGSPFPTHADGAATGAGKGGATKRAGPQKAQDGGRATTPKTRDGQAAREPSRFAGTIWRPGFKLNEPLAHTDPQLASQDRSKYFLCQFFESKGGYKGDSCKAIHVHRECYQFKDKSYQEAQHKAEDCKF